MVKKYFGKAIGRLPSHIGPKRLARIVYFFINKLSTSRTPKESLIFLLELERYLFSLTGTESCRYGQGIHPKHRHTHYHDFFTKRIEFKEKVIDIGCGNGALSYDMAKAGAQVVGVDINKDHIIFAQERFHHPGLELIHGDVLKDIQEDNYDTVVISNVLEHIKDRIGFMRRYKKGSNRIVG
jgi:2-polyprenyl-3-methyl-5-hydroxy-6-metoxy-1,4-benzoquinol methylase